jgi:hypothetical protein
VVDPIDAARWIGRDPCVSFIRSGASDLASNDLEDFNKVSLPEGEGWYVDSIFASSVVSAIRKKD